MSDTYSPRTALARIQLRRVEVPASQESPTSRACSPEAHVACLDERGLRALVAGETWALRDALRALGDDREALLDARLIARGLVK